MTPLFVAFNGLKDYKQRTRWWPLRGEKSVFTLQFYRLFISFRHFFRFIWSLPCTHPNTFTVNCCFAFAHARMDYFGQDCVSSGILPLCSVNENQGVSIRRIFAAKWQCRLSCLRRAHSCCLRLSWCKNIACGGDVRGKMINFALKTRYDDENGKTEKEFGATLPDRP